MTDEDVVAAKLKGFNAVIKFKDGEELLIKSSLLDSTADDKKEWITDVEDFINSSEHAYFPHLGLAIDRDSVKYVKIL